MISHKKIKDVSLNPLTDDVSDKLFEWRNNPKVFNWCRQNDLLQQSLHRNWFCEHQKDKTVKMYLIKAKDTPIGVCGFTDIDLINQRAEFSLYIGPEYQGQGFGKAALKLLVWHGFNSYPFHTIWGETFDGNPALKMFESLGFQKEGIRRDFYFREGKFLDAYLVSVKRDEFKL